MTDRALDELGRAEGWTPVEHTQEPTEFRTLDLSKRFDETRQRYTVILESSERKQQQEEASAERAGR